MVDPSKLTIVRKTGTAVEAIIDGQPDFAWNLVPALKTEKLGSLSAEFKTLWDRDHVYVKVDVSDGSISPGDQAEIFAVVNGAVQKRRFSVEPPIRLRPRGLRRGSPPPVKWSRSAGRRDLFRCPSNGFRFG